MNAIYQQVIILFNVEVGATTSGVELRSHLNRWTAVHQTVVDLAEKVLDMRR